MIKVVLFSEGGYVNVALNVNTETTTANNLITMFFQHIGERNKNSRHKIYEDIIEQERVKPGSGIINFYLVSATPDRFNVKLTDYDDPLNKFGITTDLTLYVKGMRG